MTKRLFSLFLAFSLCLTLLPAAFAESPETAEEEDVPLIELVEPDAEEVEADDIALIEAPELTPDLGETEASPAWTRPWASELVEAVKAVRAFTAAVPGEPDAELMEYSGTLGGASWTLNGEGLLMIKGTGTIPDYTQTQHPSFFSYRSMIKSIMVDSRITGIGSYAFLGLVNVTKVTGCDSIKYLNEGAFSACTNLKSVSLGNQLETIHAGAFMVCPALGSVRIPATVTCIEDGAFLECEALAAVNVDSGNKTYKSNSGVLYTKDGKNLLFCPYAKAGAYTVINGATTIKAGAFTDCTQLTGVTIPSSVTTIESLAFTGCSLLTGVKIPANVTDLATAAFCDNAALAEFTVDSANTAYKSVNGVVFTKNGKTLLLYPTAKSGSYTIPAGVTTVADFAFMYCPKLSGITIPNGVTTIGSLAFAGDNGIRSVTIPDNVLQLGDGIFTECRNLNSAVVGTGVKVLAPQTFYNCTGLKTVTLADTLDGIGLEAFYNCSWLESITFPKNLRAIGDGAFLGCTKLTEIEIPASVLYFGEASFAQCAKLVDVRLPANLTAVPANCFNQCTDLKEITIPDTVKTIGAYAFQNCSVLATVNLGTGVSVLEEGAFDGCKKIARIALPDSVTTIGTYAFRNCERLAEINLPYGLTIIDGAAFFGCRSLAAIELPNSLTTIGMSAFSGCSSLTSIVIPDSVTELGPSAFYECTRLRDVRIGSGVTVLRKYVFEKCDLSSIAIPATVRKLEYGVFFGNYSLKGILFMGEPPEFHEQTFIYITANVGYYEGKGWTEEHFQNYGGHLTWMPYTEVSAPVLTEAFNSATGVRVSWQPVEGATGYNVLRKNLTKNETEFTFVGSTAEPTYIDKSAVSASRYTYTVQARDAMGFPGEYDETGRTCTYIAKADITGITVTDEGVKLTWSKPAGAKNFRVMRRVDGVAKWTVLDVVLGNEYLDTTAEVGVKYWYTVRGVSLDNTVVINSYNGTGWSMKPLEKPVLTEAFNSATGVRVSWQPVEGAVKYFVLRKNVTLGETEWKQVHWTPDECTWIDTRAKSSNRYTYTVVCVDSNNRYCSAQGAPRTCTYIAMAKITEIKGTDEGVSLIWEKPAGAKNFRVFRKVDGEDKWTALTDVLGNEYLDTTAEVGVKYWYTVRAITMDGRMYINSYNSYGWSVTRK
ncbi:MAG: leucine-rich repeat protein [Oscillospiraceae bacterium]|nr:leucine-rich repeat protein [Oscillospiraceae bacterium]